MKLFAAGIMEPTELRDILMEKLKDLYVDLDNEEYVIVRFSMKVRKNRLSKCPVYVRQKFDLSNVEECVSGLLSEIVEGLVSLSFENIQVAFLLCVVCEKEYEGMRELLKSKPDEVFGVILTSVILNGNLNILEEFNKITN